MKNTIFGFAAGFIVAIGLVVFLALREAPQTPPSSDEMMDVFYPGTEELGPYEMRVVALGTGMPNARPKQAAACWLVELGNGDKFLFDIGTGSAERLSAMKIPMDYLDKLFIGHLHSDHVGDIDALWIGGNVANRMKPLRVWGPSGPTPEFGTQYFFDRLQEAYTWDVRTRMGNKDTRGLALEITEFDYKGENEIIYNENGVVIRSFPAIHIYDGCVSYTLEWNGLKFAYSSDTYPNKWWMEYAKDCDIAIHECFAAPKTLVDKQKFPPETALNVGTQIHTSPAQFGKVMATIKPRLGVGYHFFNDFDTQPLVLEQTRMTYDGPLALATDYMVFNVTKDDIVVRMAAVDEDIWPMPSTIPQLPPNPEEALTMSDLMKSGRVVYKEVLKKLYDDINKEYGSSVEVPQ